MIPLIINEFVRKRFNEYKPLINILILENQNISIFSSLNKEIIIEQTNNLQFQLLEIIELETNNIFRVKLPNGKKGYFTPVDSVLVLPKKTKQVRISANANFNNSINRYLGIDEEHFVKNMHRVVFSSQYAIFKEEIYECLTYVDEIIAFVKPEEVNVMHRHEQPFKVIKDTTIYRDSTMTKPVSNLTKGEKSHTSQYVIIEEKKLRFKDNGKIFWLNLEDTDLDIEIDQEKYNSLNELILDSILYQYSLKIENYHKYYQKILNKQSKISG